VAIASSLLLLCCAAFAPAAETAKPADARTVVLDTHQGSWRGFLAWKTPGVLTKDGAVRPLGRQPYFWHSAEDLKPKPLRAFRSTHPPQDWTGVDFDDTDWSRARGVFGRGYGGKRVTLWTAGGPAQTNVICVRGRFHVDDPAGVKDLQVEAAYQGGIVVYVNGTEVGRGHLPDGKLTFDALATPYPDELYVTEEGKKIVGVLTKKTPAELRPLYERRVRRLTATIPAKALRTGVNVLALEIHRSAVKEIWTGTWEYKGRTFTQWPFPWAHARLLRATLTAEPGSALRPNIDRPKDAQIWTTTATDRKIWLRGSTWRDPLEPARPVRIIGCRNGTFCGRVVISSPSAIAGLKAECSALKPEAGGDDIPAENVTLLYGVANDHHRTRRGRIVAAFGSLRNEAPATVAVNKNAGAAIQTVWAKVAVPKDAKPGTYKGTLTLTWTDAEPTGIPVEVVVHDWAMPDTEDFHVFIDLIQSPETLAIKYGVPQWSDKHWEYIAASLRLFGQCGNKTTYLKLITKTHFGNTQSIVRFIKDGAGWKRDYSILDQYMVVLEKEQGKPEIVILYCWERYAAQRKAPMVTVVDPKTGTLSEMKTPKYNTPEGEAFWAPVFKELRERFKQRGLENALVLGAFGDFNGLRKPDVAFFKKVAAATK
jgi:hypothetical protein